MKENEKKYKYWDFTRELKDSWNMRVTVIPFITCALGTVPKGFVRRLEEMEIGRRYKCPKYFPLTLKKNKRRDIREADLFVQAFKIVVDTWKFSMLLLYIVWDDWSIFIISGSKEQLQQQLEYTQQQPDCHSWWIW